MTLLNQRSFFGFVKKTFNIVPRSGGREAFNVMHRKYAAIVNASKN